MEPVSLNVYLLIAGALFVCGVVCMATKRNAIGVLMGVELVLAVLSDTDACNGTFQRILASGE